ncbi:aldehyde dehydrogenase family protein [Promicromonospora citrea]|uniref:Aldehyde dehydrogenase n=1 Tax=Promicromonospora citrea TaxID=43677 RepID=A0A8H9GTZ4_9MICO|nr:aldehyde dehydrogenase family protein [Promicromonospora citrea]NNH54666.1 aldehyde dehydrogenase family protein [Promicromonospora citrea]GGM42453.1 aldehyde dehydrogenase [Promicromonospora citrea]
MTEQTTDDVARRAAAAYPATSQAAPAVRADALRRAAATLGDHTDELVALAQEETGLADARLRGELTRTRVQLRLFAGVVEDGTYLDARLDEADPDFVLGPRPDLRRTLWPVGPVLVFAASNFPFAFSVAGGDTAAALAAGCPVVVKAHPGHPRLAERVAALVSGALTEAGLPDGALQRVAGQDAGVALLEHPAVRAASFTGSQRVGQLLAARAAARPDPIPFHGELGSVNPVLVSAGALRERGDELLAGYVASVSGSAGQLCTKPGFLLVPEGTAYDDAVVAAASAVAEHRLLDRAIADRYDARVAAALGADGVRVVHAGHLRRDADGHGWATPTIAAAPLDAVRAAGPALLDEVFGPFSVVVEYPEGTDLAGVVAELFPGNLTVTLHLGAREDAPVDRLARHAGRLLFGGWPTGVAVTPAMQHGGPWPATTTDATSVGTAAIGRFLRGVAYQDAPQSLLPPPLRDDNPWNVPRTLSPRGASAAW